MTPFAEYVRYESRRQFLSRCANAAGWAAMGTLMPDLVFGGAGSGGGGEKTPPGPHFAPKARNVIYLHMVGGPSQVDLFDYKPTLQEYYDKDLPDSVRMGQRLTTMTSGQKRFPIAPSKYKFERHGQCGMWVSELFPWK